MFSCILSVMWTRRLYKLLAYRYWFHPVYPSAIMYGHKHSEYMRHLLRAVYFLYNVKQYVSSRDCVQIINVSCDCLYDNFSVSSAYMYIYIYKCTLVQALRLCTGRTAHRGSRGIALLFHDHGTRRGWGVSVTAQPLFTPGKDPVHIVQEDGWAPGPVWTDEENLAPTGIRFPDRPARSQSLYRLSFPAHSMYIYTYVFAHTIGYMFATNDRHQNIKNYLGYVWGMPIPVAVRCNVWVCSRSFAGNAVSNLAGGMDVSRFWLFWVFR